LKSLNLIDLKNFFDLLCKYYIRVHTFCNHSYLWLSQTSNNKFNTFKKSVDCNCQQGSPWLGKIHQDQPLLQQHTTAATFDIAAQAGALVWPSTCAETGIEPWILGLCGDSSPTEPNIPKFITLRLLYHLKTYVNNEHTRKGTTNSMSHFMHP
jgi:hypothetical protein